MTQTVNPPQADMPWLMRYIAVHRVAAIASIASGVFGGLTSALEPYLIGVIIDHVQRGVDLVQIRNDILLLMAMSVMTVLGFYGQRRFSGTVAYGVNYDIRRTLFDNLLKLDQGFYQHYATGDLISRMYTDLDMVWRLLVIFFMRIGSSVFTLVVAFVLLATISVPLTLVVFIILSISTAFQVRVGLVLAPMFEKVQEQAGVMASLVQDTVSGIQTIKSFGAEKGAAEKFREENLEYRKRWLYFKRRNEPVGMLPNMISQATTAIVVLFGGMMTLEGTMTIGNFTQFLIYLSLISNVLLQIGTIYQRYQQTRGALTRLTPLLQEAEIHNAPNAQPLSAPRGDIEYQDVSLKAGDSEHWLLKDVSLKIPAGKIVAFVGPTGCGKTVLVNLLARVQDPTEGRVLIDNADVRNLKLEELRQAIAYVPQSTFLFSQPLHDNIRMGKETDDESLTKAIHIARVSNDLPQLPHGLDTLVGERGVMLSGGQKQRVAIARAVLCDPAILVLDDALSSVDTQTAADILADLRQVLRSRTSLIIAHRIATVKDADHIVVMSEGRIVEQGTHVDLIQQHGLYAQMVERELRDDYEREHENEIG